MRRAISTCIVNDQTFLRSGMSHFVSDREDLKIVGVAKTKAEANKLVKLHKPRLLITEIVVGTQLCFDLIQDFRSISSQNAKVLVASRQNELVFAERCLRAGANGFVSLSADLKEFERALDSILKGVVYLNERTRSEILGRMIGHDQPNTNVFDLLTHREMEVFVLTGRGLPPRQIADDLELSVKTIESYREKIKEKLGLRNSHEVLKFAIETVLFDFHEDIIGRVLQGGRAQADTDPKPKTK